MPFYTVQETARLAGSYQWVELRLFELMGGWVNSFESLEAKHMVGVQSYHHEFHAELWSRRLPQLSQHGQAATLVAAPSSQVEKWLQPTSWEGTTETEKLVGLYRVLLPQLVGAYHHHNDQTTEVTDGPTIRVLQLCLNDDRASWQQGTHLLHSMLGDQTQIEQALALQAKLESDLPPAQRLINFETS